jgi:hypothetical protein
LGTAGHQHKNCLSSHGKLGSKNRPSRSGKLEEKTQAPQCFSGKDSFFYLGFLAALL